MSDEPRLIDVRVPDDPQGLVLVLHGGGSRRERMMVSPRQLSVLRMVPIARRLAREGRGRLAVVRMLNSARGWAGAPTPVDDVRWALAHLADRFGRRLPTGLVGHSLGGRAALLASSEDGVRSVVALAPYLLPGDGPRVLGGRSFLTVHGDQDRIARIEPAAALARELERRGADSAFVLVAGGRHAMLRHHRRFDGLASAFTATVLLGEEPAGLVARLRGGERWIRA